MKYWMILSLSLCQLFSFGQIDSLRKFSYFYWGYVKNGPEIATAQGSGFFMKYNNRIFFITAKHVVAACENDFSKRRLYPDEMIICLKGNSIPDDNFFKIDIRKTKDTANCLAPYLSPDIAVYEINNSRGYKINYVELLPNNPIHDTKSAIVILGFPLNRDLVSMNNIDLGKSSIIEIKKYSLFERYRYSKILENNKWVGGGIDSLNYTVETTDIAPDIILDGFSGGPVFAKDKKENKWQLLGLMSARIPNRNVLVIVPSKFILPKIKRYHR